VAAYALPALQLATLAGLDQAEFYFALQYAVALNPTLTPKQAKVSTGITRALIEQVGQKVNTQAQPVWLEERDAFEPSRFLLASVLAYRLSQLNDEQLTRFAEARSGDDSLLYMAAHALYMWDALRVDPDRFIIERSQIPARLVMVGGPAEKIFRRARVSLLQLYPTDNTRKTAQAFSEIGRVPPYYPAQLDPVIGGKNRPTLDEILKLEDPDVRRDLLYLLIGISENISFADIKPISKGVLSQVQRDDLQAALDSLTEVTKQLES
jgi:hypothetical protein